MSRIFLTKTRRLMWCGLITHNPYASTKRQRRPNQIIVNMCILKGSGSNCTCGDCSVLYGGTCYTTPINNWLDRVEKIAYSVVGKKKYICATDVNKFLEKLRPLVCNRYKIKRNKFDKNYYMWAPMFYHCLAYRESNNNYDKYDARKMYKMSRITLLWATEKYIES